MVAVGDLVVRKSHGKDVIFRVIDIDGAQGNAPRCFLKGMHLRLFADAPLGDLEAITGELLRNEVVKMDRIQRSGLERALERRKGERRKGDRRKGDRRRPALLRGESKKFCFFDMPGSVLHLDGDDEYLKMCLKTYHQLNIDAVGRCIDEPRQPEAVKALIEQYRPDILVLTGHDAILGGCKKELKDINSYRHSKYFVEAVRRARSVIPDRDDLVIFAGACQSHFEAILSAGANFASSPTRILIRVSKSH